MCFSATASFTVGAGLLGPGIYSVKTAKAKGMLLFASTPLLFSFHQMAEGLLWLSLQDPDFSSWYKPALYGYSFISQPVWPIWVPLTVWLMETDEKRRRLLKYFVIVGAATAVYMFYCLVTYDISASAEQGHIRYYRAFPHLNITKPFNFVMLAVTPFLSTLKRTKPLAAVMAASLVVTYLFYTDFLISVWCFFAAILSVLIIWVIKANQPSV